MYNIYFRNRKLTLCEADSQVLKDNSAVILQPTKRYKFHEIPSMMLENSMLKHLVIAEDNKHSVEELYQEIFGNIKVIEAAGGLIKNSEGKYLMIYRSRVWDLPKGKQDEGEDIITTAKREVKEEVGLDCTVRDLICTTKHVFLSEYEAKKELVLKNTHWYSMSYKGSNLPIPQIEENIEKCVWCSIDDVAFNLQEAYSSIREVFEKGGIV